MPTDAPAESSTATYEFPTDQTARDEFLKTGTIPEPKPAETQPKAASTPATSSAATEKEAAEPAPASEPGKSESGPAAQRLNEILSDLKKAGLTPSELKNYRRQAASDPAKPPETTAAEKPKPQTLEAPVKPKQSDFDDYEKYVDAKDKYFEDLADYKANLAVQQDRLDRANQTARDEMAGKIAAAKQRYGAEAESAIREAANGIFTDEGIDAGVKGFLNRSKVLVDIMYVLGSKSEELHGFIELAKTDPDAALEKAVVIQRLVREELSNGNGHQPAPAEGVERDETTGKFKAPLKATSTPPPRELSTRGRAVSDPIETAVKNDDFATFKAEEDRRELAKRRGA